MSDNKEKLRKLELKIKNMRSRLVQRAIQQPQGRLDQGVLRLSQALDRLLNLYQRQKEHSDR
ncbi:MAG: aspartyl-phosphate phosphatase Spo0E family protein [Bacillota bacterium]